jgi:hypothetical protein
MDLCDIEPGQAVAVDWTEQEYFSDRKALTRSALWLLADNPAQFERQWEAGEPRPDKSNISMEFGTAGHLAILEPAEWERRLGLPIPPKPLKGKQLAELLELAAKCDIANDELLKMIPANTEAHASAVAMREKLLASIPDRIDIGLLDYLRLLCVHRSVWSHPQARTILRAPGPILPTGEPVHGIEQTIIWREPTSGLLVKVRVDKLADISTEAAADVVDLDAGIGVADLKTMRHKGRRVPWMLMKSARDLGYHVQDALYRDAVRALLPNEPVNFYFIAICSEGDFDTSTWRLPDEAVEQGREFYQQRLLEIRDRRFTYDWRHTYTRGVQTLPWSYRR